MDCTEYNTVNYNFQVELDKRNADTIELRKESNKTFLELQNKLELRSTQLSAVQEKYDRLEQVFKEVEKESNELRDKLTGQAQDEIDYRVHLEAQLNAQKAFVQAHKEALDATKSKCIDMETTIVELKTSLDAQNSKQVALEAENKRDCSLGCKSVFIIEKSKSLKKDVEKIQAESKASIAKLESRVTELLSSESKLRQELRTTESEANELKIKLRKLVTENEYKEEMLTTLRHNGEFD
ncbi:uncharacterized protein At4g38062-like [Diaphorina citri]|uniref:Uncharacterized protein At4g38062-like n=1 Tax=Diaphorina citri TaxID=121845 RepID=A0A3Q0IZM2_DIACI|nr:uncharacterized protein At4g38062-like [Diaphorina citri]